MKNISLPAFILASLMILAIGAAAGNLSAHVRLARPTPTVPHPTATPPSTPTPLTVESLFHPNTSGPTPSWLSLDLPEFNLNITIPTGWKIFEDRRLQLNGLLDLCIGYLVDAPDYLHELSIRMSCPTESASAPCPAGYQVITPIQQTTLIRFPDPVVPNLYHFATTLASPDCTLPDPPEIRLHFHGILHNYLIDYTYNGAAPVDFTLVDAIVRSFVSNP